MFSFSKIGPPNPSSKPPQRVLRTWLLVFSHVMSERMRLLIIASFQLLVSLLIVGLAAFVLRLVRESQSTANGATGDSFDQDRVSWLIIFLLVLAAVETLVGALGFFAALHAHLGHLVFHFWATSVLCFPVAFFAISCLTLHDSYTVLVEVSWRTSGLAAAREEFCDGGTANGACLVPIDGGLNDTEAEWCDNFFTQFPEANAVELWANGTNSDICSTIRNDAQDELIEEARIWLRYLGSAALVFVLIKVYSLKLIADIVTHRFLFDHMKYLAVFILAMLSVICTYYGRFLTNRLDEVNQDESQWAAGGCLALGTLSVSILLLGVLGMNLHLSEIVYAHFWGVVLLAMGFMAHGIALLIYSDRIRNTLTDAVTEDEADAIACDIFHDDCCCCDLEDFSDQCKEWNTSRIATLLDGDFVWIGVIMVFCGVACAASSVENLMVYRRIQQYKRSYI